MPHAFLSYVREDLASAERLATALREAGVDVWMDRSHILPGQRWQTVIRNAIREGAFFLACFSTNYNRKQLSYMNEELGLAVEQLRQMPVDRTWFIPLLLDATEIPDRDIGVGQTLRSIQWLDLYADWQRGIEVLVRLLGGLPNRHGTRRPNVKAPSITSQQQEANDWEATLKADTLDGYRDFLAKHSTSRNTVQAYQAIQIKERNREEAARTRQETKNRAAAEQIEKAWQYALRQNSILGYRDFLEHHPTSRYSNQAKLQLSLLEGTLRRS
jgi:hypothetical protein